MALLETVLIEPQHEEAHESHWYDFLPMPVWNAANLVLFLVLLWWLLKKPLSSFLGGRRAEVAEAQRKAEADRRRAEELAAQINARLSRIEGEIQDIRSHAARESESEQAALLQQAEVDARRIAERATAEIETRAREKREELTAYAGDLAVTLAEQMVKKSLTPEDERRLVTDGLGGLKTATGRK
jgi:F-type H+-transporting ATPase subunit b